MELFRPAVRSWFESAHPAPTRVQREGWPVLASGRNALLIAPTGSGKTLAAFLWAIDQVSRLDPDASPGVRILYVSPLKALVYDVDRNLRTPLAGITARREDGLRFRGIGVSVRTGDTTAKERRRQLREPADVLVTTPESLYLLLGSRASQHLKTVGTVIVDEIHAVAGTKRGAHLALSLERLSELTGRDPQRIGLSATVRPPQDVARFLGGDREVEIVDASEPAHVDLSIRVPGPELAHQPGTLWGRLYPEILELVRSHQSTLIFVNSRSLAEKTAQRLNEIAEAPLVRAHHGSLSHQKRNEIEEALKRGELQGIVATSSLELGIDMGAVDLVILVESPGSVARGLQRVGRSGHSVGEMSKGILFPKFRGDLLECAVVAERMIEGEIEAVRVPECPLDVLAQQVTALCAESPRRVDDILSLARRAFPYRGLTREILVSVVEMLSGHYSGADLADLRPRLAWDRSRDVLSARAGAKMLSLLNAGTIPDRGLYAVHLGESGPRIGELDEEMVYEARRGETFTLGATTYRIEGITRDRVIVSAAPGEPGKTPFWRGDGPGRPLELGRALGRFTREIVEIGAEEARGRLTTRSRLDAASASQLLGYLEEQREQGSIPTDRNVVIERFRDELGDWRIAILTPFGARVHAPWALAVQNALSARAGFEVETTYSDDGIILRFGDVDALPGTDLLVPAAEEVEDRVVEELADSALFASVFRESAARALLLPRRGPERRTPLWQQRLRAKNLLAVVRRYPAFPIVLETYRHCLKDVFDLPALREILSGIGGGEIKVSEVSTDSPSVFARSLAFAYIASYLYEQDAPAAERRAHALSLDRGLLRELLGETELRAVLDADAVTEVEAEISGRAPGWRARSPDELEDLLRRVGDLSLAEMEERATEDPGPWIAKLTEEKRALAIPLAGENRYVLAADAPRYRDFEGLEDLLRRFARTRGPFQTADAAARFALPPERVQPILEGLESEGRLVRGEIRPSGKLLEWCEVDVLRRLKRRTLEKLRKEAAPVEPAVLGRFLPAWQGLEDRGRGLTRLEDVLVRLEGLPLPWSSLVETVLPQRVEDFRVEMLDLLSASGAIVWVGKSALGNRDGRIAFYRRERAPLLLDAPPRVEPRSDLEARILERLTTRGASFEIELALREDDLSMRALQATLLTLMWEGRITNDTFFPLRSLGKSRTRRGSSGRRPPNPKYAGGRWSLVEGLLDPSISDTERAHARVTMLLERYGLASRAAAQFEEIPGGYASIYPVLREMEERGRLRRGHFVEGLSGSQFALGGAVERLRSLRNHPASETRALLAVDPANPYGSILPWPPTDVGARPRRVPGAWIVLHRGELALYMEKGGRTLLSFGPFSDPEVARAALGALTRLPRRRPHRLRIGSIDERPPVEGPYFELLLELGFFREASTMVFAEHPRRGP